MRKAPYEVPENKKVRVIIDTDCACEADDQPALAHSLMTPKFEVVGVTAAHYNLHNGAKSVRETMENSVCEAQKVIGLMGLSEQIKVYPGCPDVMKDENTPVDSPAVRFIIQEALKQSERPLFVAVQGAITNIASALLINPEIAGRFTVIWIGGGPYPSGEWEYNAMNDVHAANAVMDSAVELWQVPKNVYAMMKVSFASFHDRIYHCGAIGKYIVDKMMDFNAYNCALPPRLMQWQQDFSPAARLAKYRSGEMWQVGDSPVIGLMLADHEGHYTLEGAPRFDTTGGQYLLRPGNKRKIRVYHYVDNHFILEDFYAKMQYYFGQ